VIQAGAKIRLGNAGFVFLDGYGHPESLAFGGASLSLPGSGVAIVILITELRDRHPAAECAQRPVVDEAVEFFFPFAARHCYEKYDCTGQQLIDEGVVRHATGNGRSPRWLVAQPDHPDRTAACEIDRAVV
jgi:hypothetical protein